MAIRFHLDEHLSPVIADALRQKGIDISTSQEAALLGESDHDQLAFAVSQGRALVTCDNDFLCPQSAEQASFGICYCRPQKYSLQGLINALLVVEGCMTENELKNHVEWL